MRFKFSIVLMTVGMAMALSPSGRTQGLLKEALSTFPAGTVHIEVSSPATLRRLPNYSSLRARYLGPSLNQLEGSLATLGIHESDIDDLALGWKSEGGAAELYGIALGRFDTKGIAQSAEQRGISPENVRGFPVYCLGSGLESDCVLLLSDSEGAFGTFAILNDMMDVRLGAKPNLASDQQVAKVVQIANTEAPIWGVAVGSSMADWFKTWMPGQKTVQLDWSQVLSGVDALAYSIGTGNTVKLGMKFECGSEDKATSLRQILEGLRLAQQIAWQNQNPNTPNPYTATEISMQEKEVQLQVDTSYDSLMAMGAPGNPGQ